VLKCHGAWVGWSEPAPRDVTELQEKISALVPVYEPGVLFVSGDARCWCCWCWRYCMGGVHHGWSAPWVACTMDGVYHEWCWRGEHPPPLCAARAYLQVCPPR
jgi:hypothetical protein